ncbi:hypothetical protein Mp_5g11420 [Marchantia polymorpha subsp. ruderalis]|uniref:Ribosomal protein S3 C-terminal domain-containing protein n=2 Tax=Marchantia polymorpha TaxID=3197 RepID=A0AAF6BH97_MARPO|nr:hypothetical protein MARPO_0093s0065 [Marchantia polymorpha]BBN11381.1 hypothetical protein Mp_5g11420 [Marchantia polymorpha subsp. ruderalis]|eukprot:PTQ32994.1 hypothetical protein MARPO_0093s0065 [Marchantia polymorpha]
MEKSTELANRGNIKGIEIEISGRLDGAETARSERALEPQTVYGIIEIKIWIFEDEE